MACRGLYITVLVAALSNIISCGGGGGDKNVVADSSNNSALSIQGTLVAPQLDITINNGGGSTNTNTGGARLVAKSNHSNCSSVPNGYRAVADATLVFLDVSQNPIGPTWKSGNCGDFMRVPPAGAATLKASIEGYQELISPLTQFRGGLHNSMAVVSLIPEKALYEIGMLQRLDATHIGFTLVDSKSHQPVLGLTADSLGVQVNDNAPLSVHPSQESIFEKASIAFVLDASSSMGTTLSANIATTKYQAVASAIHAFVDGKKSDEVAVIIFSDSVNYIDQAAINSLFIMTNQDGTPASHKYPEDGFITIAKPIRFVIDAYNKHSNLYAGLIATPSSVHKETPVVTIASYPFGNFSMFYDAIDTALTRVESRETKRKWIVTFNDDPDDKSTSTLAQIISKANNKNIPVFAIEQSGVNATLLQSNLQAIAEGSGGIFYPAVGNDVSRSLENIQLSLRHEFVVEAAAPINLDTVKLTLNVRGTSLNRTLAARP